MQVDNGDGECDESNNDVKQYYQLFEDIGSIQKIKQTMTDSGFSQPAEIVKDIAKWNDNGDGHIFLQPLSGEMQVKNNLKNQTITSECNSLGHAS